MSDIDLRYPLSYPTDRVRTPIHKREVSRFEVGFSKARDELLAELQRFGAKDIIISTNVPLRKDGLPYANFREPGDPGVAVYFKLKGESLCFTCDGWDRVKDNLRDICLTIQAKRMLLQHRKTASSEQEFRGYRALPAEAQSNGSVKTWWQVLGVRSDRSWEDVKMAYRALARQHHPDVGGDRAQWDKIQAAYEQAEAALKPQGVKP